MKSIRELYRIGTGPSSSHTMGPRKAAEIFLGKHPEAKAFQVTLYGSLAATGKGHMTDVAILDTLQPHAPTEIIWKAHVFYPFHPNGMTFKSLNEKGKVTDEWTVFSVGGGALAEEGHDKGSTPEIYDMNRMSEILYWCERTGRNYWEYVQQCEDKDIWDYLAEVWKTMREAIERGLDQEGVLPGPLNLRRKASTYYIKAKGYKDNLRSRGLVFSYALAVSEENASGGKIVTAPTCGSCGVVPAVLYHLQKSRDFSDMRILRALATAGLIGNIVKHNASISGAEAGCQATHQYRQTTFPFPTVAVWPTNKPRQPCGHFGQKPDLYPYCLEVWNPFSPQPHFAARLRPRWRQFLFQALPSRHPPILYDAP